MRILRGLVAALVSAVISIIGFVLFGALLPIWAMDLVYGTQSVQDSPGHGGLVLLATLSIAGLLAVCGFWVMAPLVYRRLLKRAGH